jgi:hypothetical protein
MRKVFLSTLFMTTVLLGCNNQRINQAIEKVNADVLIRNYEKYSNSTIVTEGLIIHVCSADGGKMQLKTESGEIIKIVPFDSSTKFDNAYYKKAIQTMNQLVHKLHRKSSFSKIERPNLSLMHYEIQ